MNQEREMILKMLKDGKVTVEEAEALLEVLEETGKSESQGAPIDMKTNGVESERRSRPEHGRADRPRRSHEEAGHSDHQGGGGEPHGPREGFRFAFDKDFDFSSIGDTVRRSLSGLKETLRDAMDGIGEIDFGAELKRAFGKEQAHADLELSFATEGISTVAMENGNGTTGDVRVMASADDMLHITGHVTAWANDAAEARARADAVTIDAVADGDTLRLSARTGDEEALRRSRVHYQIRLPKGLSVGINTIGGDVSVEGVTADVGISTISGDVEVSEASGSVNARSVSGDVSIAFEAGPTGDLAVKTVSGDVVVSLPDDPSARVDLRTTGGDIRCGLPMTVEDRSRTKLIGVIADGLVSIEASTISGDLVVS